MYAVSVLSGSPNCCTASKVNYISTEAEFMYVHCTITLRFLGIILRVLRLEVSVWISKTIGKGGWFSIRFFFFLLYRNCKRLRVEEIKISSKAVEVTVNNKEDNS
jgi:hypothetical protein